jgi:exopolysaccharide biosynthesis polyprenyl glycosylphosphotransferase
MQSSTRSKPIGWRVHTRDQRIILLIGDVFVSTIALFGALYFWGSKDAWLKFSLHFLQQRVDVWFWFLPVIWMVFLVELYNPHRARNLRQTVGGIALAALAGLLLYALVYLISEKGSLPRLGIGFFLVFASILTLIWRLLFIRISTNQAFLHRVLIIGAGSAGETLVKVYNKMNPKPFILVGFMDDDPGKVGKILGGVPILAGNDRLLENIESNSISEIVIAITGEMKGSTFQNLLEAQQRGMEIIPMPSLYEELLGRVPINHLESEWLIRSFVNESRVDGFYELAKRLLDILLSLVGLFICILLTPFTAILIFLDSGLPILYSQVRSGMTGKPYNIYKFRTMRTDAEKNGKVQVTVEHDERITHVGNILRRSHIDELPQFWNVLVGDMSIVGPRAERPELIIEYQKQIPLYRARLLVKPGITGWAQINYGYTSTTIQTVIKLEYDLYYIKHRNLLMDITIILRTLTQVIGFQGR